MEAKTRPEDTALPLGTDLRGEKCGPAHLLRRRRRGQQLRIVCLEHTHRAADGETQTQASRPAVEGHLRLDDVAFVGVPRID